MATAEVNSCSFSIRMCYDVKIEKGPKEFLGAEVQKVLL